IPEGEHAFRVHVFAHQVLHERVNSLSVDGWTGHARGLRLAGCSHDHRDQEPSSTPNHSQLFFLVFSGTYDGGRRSPDEGITQVLNSRSVSSAAGSWRAAPPRVVHDQKKPTSSIANSKFWLARTSHWKPMSEAADHGAAWPQLPCWRSLKLMTTCRQLVLGATS